MSRTGTLSTKTAIEAPGFGPCHHMMDCSQTLPKRTNGSMTSG
ncbi:sulfotransferase [Jannaschia sp. CCS1]|nr:sulfotransferase [Jannaschia sp. CCS1]